MSNLNHHMRSFNKKPRFAAKTAKDLLNLPVQQAKKRAAPLDKHTVPTNPTEAKLQEMWQRVLKIEDIGINDAFPRLGGNSIDAAALVSKIHKTFNVKMELSEIFRLSTIKRLSQHIKEAARDNYSSIRQVELKEYYPVTHAQKRLWVVCQFKESSVAYNLVLGFIFNGALNRDAFARAFHQVVQRHDSLRTVFITVNGEPQQKVQGKTDTGFNFEQVDLRNHPQQEQEAGNLTRQEAGRRFDLAKGPLLAARLLRLQDEKYLFLFNMHHIISDGWSMGVLTRDVCALYNDIIQARHTSLPPLTIQYKDFSHWQHKQLAGQTLTGHRHYWLTQFNNGIDVPILQLPYDYPRPKVKTYNGDTLGAWLPIELSQQIIDLSRCHDTSLFILLLASIKALLYRYSGQEDIVVGSPISGRMHSDLENQIGFFVNTLALRSVFSGSDSFAGFLAKVKETCLDAYEHDVYPFDQLVEDLQLDRNTSRSPLFDVFVALNLDNENIPAQQGLEGIKLEGLALTSKISRFDLVISFTRSSSGIHVNIEYNTDLFARDRIERMCGHFQGLLQDIVRDNHTPLNQLNYLSTEERHQLLDEFGRPIIGEPMGNITPGILAKQHKYYILDAALNPVPIGVDGDIWIGGPAAPHHDSDQPQLKRERLIKNPFVPGEVEMLWSTGQRGRYLADGQIAMRNREAESASQTNRAKETGDVVNPRNETERKLVNIWAKVLGEKEENIDVTADFFQLGGNSIKGLMLISEINEAFNVNLLITHLYEYMTIETFAGKLNEMSTTPSPSSVVENETLPDQEQEPEGFTYNELSREQFARLGEKYPHNIQDIYPLTPNQEGMIFHALYDHSSLSLFINQSSFRLNEALNVALVEKSFEILLNRFDILRTVFIYEGIGDIDRPLQLVLKERKIEFYFEDISEKISASEKEGYLREFKIKDRQRRFDLSRDLLLRVSLIKVEPAVYDLIWTYHDILIDGWSRSVLFTEFREIYSSHLQGRDHQLPPATPFKTYIKWLEKQDRNESKKYWQKYLQGYDPIAEVPKRRTAGNKGAGYNIEMVSFVFHQENIDALNRMAKKNRVTLNIIIQTLWGILLGKYSGKNDVVYGIAVSGRPPEIKGFETMVGLLTNVIPVRIRFKKSITFSQLIREVQQEAIKSEPHHHTPLVEIQGEILLKQNLFDHAYGFGNVPRYDELQENPGSRQESGEIMEILWERDKPIEQTNYDLAIYVTPKKIPEIDFVYNANTYSRDFMKKIPLHLGKIIDMVIKNENIAINDITIESDLASIESSGFDTTQPDFDF